MEVSKRRVHALVEQTTRRETLAPWAPPPPTAPWAQCSIEATGQTISHHPHDTQRVWHMHQPATAIEQVHPAPRDLTGPTPALILIAPAGQAPPQQPAAATPVPSMLSTKPALTRLSRHKPLSITPDRRSPQSEKVPSGVLSKGLLPKSPCERIPRTLTWTDGQPHPLSSLHAPGHSGQRGS